MADGNGKPGLGDIQRKDVDLLETYFDIMSQGVNLPRRKWIVKPEWTPPDVPGLNGIQKFFEAHAIPRLWQLLADFFVKAQEGLYFVKNPNWIEPPITARPLDLRNETAVVVGAANTNIVTFTMPDRYIGSCLAFGHGLTVPAEFGTVIWNIFVNNRPVETYAEFRQQIGTYVDPTPFPSPIKLKGRDIVRVTARTAGGATSAFVRMPSFIFPAKRVTQDGSYKDYRTQ